MTEVTEMPRECHKNGPASRKGTLWYNTYRAKLMQLFGMMKDVRIKVYVFGFFFFNFGDVAESVSVARK